jgi:hypothetical protein
MPRDCAPRAAQDSANTSKGAAESARRGRLSRNPKSEAKCCLQPRPVAGGARLPDPPGPGARGRGAANTVGARGRAGGSRRPSLRVRLSGSRQRQVWAQRAAGKVRRKPSAEPPGMGLGVSHVWYVCVCARAAGGVRGPALGAYCARATSKCAAESRPRARPPGKLRPRATARSPAAMKRLARGGGVHRGEGLCGGGSSRALKQRLPPARARGASRGTGGGRSGGDAVPVWYVRARRVKRPAARGARRRGAGAQMVPETLGQHGRGRSARRGRSRRGAQGLPWLRGAARRRGRARAGSGPPPPAQLCFFPTPRAAAARAAAAGAARAQARLRRSWCTCGRRAWPRPPPRRSCGA